MCVRLRVPSSSTHRKSKRETGDKRETGKRENTVRRKRRAGEEEEWTCKKLLRGERRKPQARGGTLETNRK